jgi:PRC-barrel domain
VVDNLGAPVAYLVLGKDRPVYDPDGQQVGHVAQVLADEGADIFHGLVISRPGTPGRYRFVDPSQIAGLYERGVTLSVTADQLHDPAEDPIAAGAAGDGTIGAGLRRAWEWLNRRV